MLLGPPAALTPPVPVQQRMLTHLSFDAPMTDGISASLRRRNAEANTRHPWAQRHGVVVAGLPNIDALSTGSLHVGLEARPAKRLMTTTSRLTRPPIPGCVTATLANTPRPSPGAAH
jgi:hypothetical protein